MKENIEKILDYVCSVCDITREEVLSHNRTMPLPMVRGFFWYLIRRTTGYSNLHIAKAISQGDYVYTSAGVGSAITRTIAAISADKLWASRWANAIIDLDLGKAVEKDEEVIVTMTVPKGMSRKVKIDVKEKVR